jgi:hypothetical protein
MIRAPLAIVVTLCACNLTEDLGRTLPPLGAGHLELRWAVPIGGIEANFGDRVIATSSGDVVVAGSSFVPTDFAAAPAVLPAEIGPQEGGVRHAFVAQRAAANGGHMWGHTFSGGYTSEIRTLDLDGDDNVIAVGHVVTSTTPEGWPTDADTIVAKIDPAGTVLWERGLGGASLSEGYGLAVGADGTIFVAGRFAGAVDLGGGVLYNTDAPPPPGGSYEGYVGDAFVAAFSATGDLLWGKAFQAAGIQAVSRLAIAEDGDLMVQGYSRDGAVSLGGDPLEGFMLARFTADGEHVWSWDIASSTGMWVSGRLMTVDELGNTYLVTSHATETGSSLVGYLLDGEGEILETMPMSLPGFSGASAAANGMVVTIGSTPESGGAPFVSVSDQHGSPLAQVTYPAVQVPSNSPQTFHLGGVHVDSLRRVAVAGNLTWAVDLGSGVIWPHGAGPIDDTGLNYQTGGCDALAAVFDWVED